jgi:hypothetical protein
MFAHLSGLHRLLTSSLSSKIDAYCLPSFLSLDNFSLVKVTALYLA